MLDGASLQDLSAGLIALVAALTALGWLLKRIWRFLRIAVKAAETIQRELTPNGGGSTYDLVRKVNARVDQLETQAGVIGDKANEAVIAAGLAVNEAKAARGILTEKHDDLVQHLTEAAKTARLKEVAYVRALNALGIPLTEIAQEVLEDDRRRPTE